jgi:hypothetical protein
MKCENCGNDTNGYEVVNMKVYIHPAFLGWFKNKEMFIIKQKVITNENNWPASIEGEYVINLSLDDVLGNE